MSDGTSTATTGLVLAGGGVAGIAWELGVLQGLVEADADLGAQVLAADLVVGTSAGSAVGAQVTSGAPMADLVAAQLAEEHGELEVEVDFEQLVADLGRAAAGTGSERERRRAIAAVALAADTVDEAARRAAVATRLPSTTWSPRLRVTVVDAATGGLLVLDAAAGVDLVDAVTASCAVPGVWPPATISGRRYVDGGVRSASNADLAVGCDRVVVVTPTPAAAPQPFGDLTAEVRTLARARVHVVHADEASVAAYGPNPLSPATRAASLRAGVEVGRTAAPALRAAWGD